MHIVNCTLSVHGGLETLVELQVLTRDLLSAQTSLPSWAPQRPLLFCLLPSFSYVEVLGPLPACTGSGRIELWDALREAVGDLEVEAFWKVVYSRREARLC
jgi:hypothetical protein